LLTLYPNGCSLGKAGMNKAPSKRGSCGGWSPAVARRNMRFLWSVENDKLDGVGFSLTFTVQTCPETAKDWSRLVDRLSVALMRGTKVSPSAMRLHWVTEWQKRGVPHLHGAVYFAQEAVEAAGGPSAMEHRLVAVWTHLAASYGSQKWSQTVKHIYDALGWSQYVAKHAARGARHIQRSSHCLPSGWQGQTGRMWGKSGVWPVAEALKFEFGNMAAYAAFRRLMRSYSKAQARVEMNAARSALVQAQGQAGGGTARPTHSLPLSSPNPPADDAGAARERAQSGSAVGQPKAVSRVRSAARGVSYTRRMLKCPDAKISAFRGMSRWAPAAVIRGMVQNLWDRGLDVAECISDA
jgi:hypothetical protein